MKNAVNLTMAKRLLAIFFCTIGLTAYAVDYHPANAPSATMQSVNNSTYMISGSTYTATVYEIGSSSPASNAPAAGPRKAPPGTDTSGYDTENPQFAPLGDALLPLMLMAFAFMGIIYLRRKKIP